jgi:hypothetical protein
VQQTAQALGYDSTTAFITMFKKGSGRRRAAITAAWLRLPNKQRDDPGGNQRADRDAAKQGDAEHRADQQPATRCGWEPISATPRPPSHETNTPTAIASSDFQFIKEWISVEGGSVPLAMGAITPMVRIMIPTVSPCFQSRERRRSAA